MIRRLLTWLSSSVEDVCKLRGFKRHLVAALLGVLGALTLPPFYFYPLLIPVYSGLLLLIVSAPKARTAFAAGWWFGLGYFVMGLYWFAHALLVEADKFAWMIPFAVFGLPSILGIYYGIAAWLCWRLPLRGAIAKVIAFSLIWLVIELLRGHLFTGFPWNLAGYSWTFSTVMIQLASVINSYGLTGWTILLAALPAVALWPQKRSKSEVECALLLTFVMLMLPFAYGCWRLSEYPTEYTNTKIRVVQANIQQAHKWDPELQHSALEKHIALSVPLSNEDKPDVIIWPESAYPFILEPNSPPLEYVAKNLPQESLLITGSLRAEREGVNQFKVWNSLSVVDSSANRLAYYDKHRLVPFGEFIPLRWLLPMEKKITHGIQDFIKGSGVEILKIGKNYNVPPFLALICYEAVFPDLAQSDSGRPMWLLNITNDAWFGESSGPYQHMQMTRMRAVEQGVPLVRAANTGVSLIVDGYGRILHELPLNGAGVMRANLPSVSKRTEGSSYGLYKMLIIYILLMVVFLCFFINKFRNFK